MTNKQIKDPGMHLLAVIHHEIKQNVRLIYDLYYFRLRNLAGDQLELNFLAPAGCKPTQLVRDLISLWKLGYFAKMNLKSHGKYLSISSIAEPEMAQDELRAHMPESKRLVLSR